MRRSKRLGDRPETVLPTHQDDEPIFGEKVRDWLNLKDEVSYLTKQRDRLRDEIRAELEARGGQGAMLVVEGWMVIGNMKHRDGYWANPAEWLEPTPIRHGGKE